MPSRLSSTNKTKWALSWRLKILMDVDGQLGEKFHRLAPLVLRIDRQGAVEHGQRFGIAALIKFYPAVEIQRGGRLGIFFERLRGEVLGFRDAPGIEQFFAGFELGIGLGAGRRGRQKKPKQNGGEKQQSVLQGRITRRDF